MREQPRTVHCARGGLVRPVHFPGKGFEDCGMGVRGMQQTSSQHTNMLTNLVSRTATAGGRSESSKNVVMGRADFVWVVRCSIVFSIGIHSTRVTHVHTRPQFGGMQRCTSCLDRGIRCTTHKTVLRIKPRVLQALSRWMAS